MRTFEVECLNIAKYCSSLQIDPPHFMCLCWLCVVSCWKVEIRSQGWIASQANSELFRGWIWGFKKTYIDYSCQVHLLPYLVASCISFSGFEFCRFFKMRCQILQYLAFPTCDLNALFISTVSVHWNSRRKIKFTNICLTIYVADCTWTYEQEADKKFEIFLNKEHRGLIRRPLLGNAEVKDVWYYMHVEMIQAMHTEFGINIFREGFTWNTK